MRECALAGPAPGSEHARLRGIAWTCRHLPRSRPRGSLAVAPRAGPTQADRRAACGAIGEVHVLAVSPVLPADVLHGVRGVHGAAGTANGLHGSAIRSVDRRRLVPRRWVPWMGARVTGLFA